MQSNWPLSSDHRNTANRSLLAALGSSSAEFDTKRSYAQPMPWFDVAVLTDRDLNAVFAYFKSLKPIQNKVPESVPPPKQ